MACKNNITIIDNKNEILNIDNKYDDSEKILEFCKILDLVDISIIKDYVKKDIDNNKDYFDELKLTYKISDPKKAEWILSKAIKNSILVGNGNTFVDIIVNDIIGVDVCVLTLNNSYTNEKSIIQNFTCNNLDSLFTVNKG